MGIRNKITQDGFVETNIDGSVGYFGHQQQFVTGNVASGSAVSAAVSTGLTILSGAQITCSLPTLSTATAVDGTIADGIVCNVVLASASTFIISASAPINGGAWTTETVAASSSMKSLMCVGISGMGLGVTGSFGWLISSGSLV